MHVDDQSNNHTVTKIKGLLMTCAIE